MKLRRKFTIIVAITIVQVLLLVVLILKDSSKMQKVKNYQYVQSIIEVDLGGTLNLLNQIDYWGLELTDIHDEFLAKMESLNENYTFISTDSIVKSFSDSFITSLGQQNLIWNVFRTKFSKIAANIKELQELPYSPEALAIINSEGVRAAAKSMPDDLNLKRAFEIVEGIHGQMEGILRSGKRLSKLNAECAVAIGEIISKKEIQSFVSSILLAIVTCVFMCVLILFVTKGIVISIEKIRDMTSVLASKDFTIGLIPEGSNEMKSLMANINNMVNQVNAFFIVVKNTASKAIASGRTINDSANSTSEATSEIDNNLGEINKEFEEISDSIQFSVDAINDMNDHVEVLVENNGRQTSAIDESNKAVNAAATTLEYINQMAMQRTKSAEEMHALVADGDAKINQTSKVLNDITNQLDKVRAIVTIINKVSAKTNLLSMNAAIEAAHAGEAGKGFSVVAGEIRALAEETSKNAILIEGVVKNIVNAVSEANSSSASASTAFVRVRDHADQIINSLQEITDGVGSIDSKMHQIKETSEETACAADEINTYCTNLAILQKEVSEKVDSMNELFIHTKSSVADIKKETVDIVNRVREVSESSSYSYKNMVDLENVLNEFKTKNIAGELLKESNGNIIVPDNMGEVDPIDNIEIIDPIDEVGELRDIDNLDPPDEEPKKENFDFDFNPELDLFYNENFDSDVDSLPELPSELDLVEENNDEDK